ncbi:MAG: hypothetical protein IJT18_02175 [Oscillospiraceae bacterium]|nr:hypothetical protein [Oscillospiraceae bacterium]
MDDMEGRIAEILNDPEKLGQVMEIAKGLGFPPPESAQDAAPNPLAGFAPDDRQAALLRAIAPYLRPDRQQRLRRALEVAKLSRLARLALQNPPQAERQVEDDV